MNLYALSLIQPFAEMLLDGRKLIENRRFSLPVRFQGKPILLHASKTPSFKDPLPEFLRDEASHYPSDLPRGGIVGWCRFQPALLSSGDLDPGAPDKVRQLHDQGKLARWHILGQRGFWVDEIHRLPFLAWPGARGWWEVPKAILDQLPPELRELEVVKSHAAPADQLSFFEEH